MTKMHTDVCYDCWVAKDKIVRNITGECDECYGYHWVNLVPDSKGVLKAEYYHDYPMKTVKEVPPPNG